MKSRDGLGDTSWHCFMQGLFTAVHKKVCYEQYATFDILKYSLKERFKGQRQWKVDDMLIFLTFIAACFLFTIFVLTARYETEYWYIKNGLLFSWCLGCLTAKNLINDFETGNEGYEKLTSIKSFWDRHNNSEYPTERTSAERLRKGNLMYSTESNSPTCYLQTFSVEVNEFHAVDNDSFKGARSRNFRQFQHWSNGHRIN